MTLKFVDLDNGNLYGLLGEHSGRKTHIFMGEGKQTVKEGLYLG